MWEFWIQMWQSWMQIIKHVKTSCYGQAMACFSSNSCRRSIFHYESILAPISGELTQIFTFCMSAFFVVDFIFPTPVKLRPGNETDKRYLCYTYLQSLALLHWALPWHEQEMANCVRAHAWKGEKRGWFLKPLLSSFSWWALEWTIHCPYMSA